MPQLGQTCKSQKNYDMVPYKKNSSWCCFGFYGAIPWPMYDFHGIIELCGPIMVSMSSYYDQFMNFMFFLTHTTFNFLFWKLRVNRNSWKTHDLPIGTSESYFLSKERLCNFEPFSPTLHHWIILIITILIGHGVSKDLLFSCRQWKLNLDGFYYGSRL